MSEENKVENYLKICVTVQFPMSEDILTKGWKITPKLMLQHNDNPKAAAARYAQKIQSELEEIFKNATML